MITSFHMLGAAASPLTLPEQAQLPDGPAHIASAPALSIFVVLTWAHSILSMPFQHWRSKKWSLKRVKYNNHCPWSSGCAPVNTTQDSVILFFYHFYFFFPVYQDHRSSSTQLPQPVSPSLYGVLGVLSSQIQNSTFVLVEFHMDPVGSLLKPKPLSVAASVLTASTHNLV